MKNFMCNKELTLRICCWVWGRLWHNFDRCCWRGATHLMPVASLSTAMTSRVNSRAISTTWVRWMATPHAGWGLFRGRLRSRLAKRGETTRSFLCWYDSWCWFLQLVLGNCRFCFQSCFKVPGFSYDLCKGKCNKILTRNDITASSILYDGRVMMNGIR